MSPVAVLVAHVKCLPATTASFFFPMSDVLEKVVQFEEQLFLSRVYFTT